MKRYSEEFKRKAVRMALEGGMSHSRVGCDLRISINTLTSWIKAAKVTRGVRPGKLSIGEPASA